MAPEFTILLEPTAGGAAMADGIAREMNFRLTQREMETYPIERA